MLGQSDSEFESSAHANMFILSFGGPRIREPAMPAFLGGTMPLMPMLPIGGTGAHYPAGKESVALVNTTL